MKTITPNQFNVAFLNSVSSVNADIVALWDKRRDYTALMLDKVFPKIADHLGIKVFNGNYYYLDSVFYAEQDSEYFGPTAIYAKCISIAIEHEHKLAGTEVEMNKLQLFNAPLKVLITYTDTPLQRTEYLDRYTKILRGADIFNDFATLRRQLVIFGSLPQQTAIWNSYVYEATGFQELQTV